MIASFTVLWMCVVLRTAYTIPYAEFYPFGRSEGDYNLGPNDDQGAHIALGHVFPFFGGRYSRIHVCNIPLTKVV